LREGVVLDGSVELQQLRSVTGAGVEAILHGERLRVGSPAYALSYALALIPPQIASWQAEGDTVLVLADDKHWRALFRVRDVARGSAAPAIADLHERGLDTALLSGDSAPAALKMATSLGIHHAWGAMSPEGKHDRLRELQQQGHVVAMVGDGVNDAPVLAQAQVSIAMGSGTELARTQSDIVLLGENLQQLAQGVATARRTMRIVRQNLGWAFAYNLLAIPAAMGGWVTPWMAGIGMSASSLLVVLNALRLTRYK